MTLSRETVTMTALRLLDETGLDGLTLRKIAAELHVQAPALYWHFTNKQELLDAMAATVLAASAAGWLPALDGASWQEAALILGRGLRQTLLRHRDGARLFNGALLTHPALAIPVAAALTSFTRAGFPTREAALALTTIDAYALGAAIREQGLLSRPGDAVLPVPLDAQEYADPADRFDHGLRLIVAGLERPVTGKTRKSKKSKKK